VPGERPDAVFRRLVIIDKSSPSPHRYSKQQLAKWRASARVLASRNAAIRAEIAGLQQRKEQELASVSLTHPERMDALEREYDRNLNQLNRLQDRASQP